MNLRSVNPSVNRLTYRLKYAYFGNARKKGGHQPSFLVINYEFKKIIKISCMYT